MTHEESVSEPIADKLETALKRYPRFLLPVVVMVIGLVLLFIIWFASLADILNNHPGFDPFELLEYPLGIDYWTISVVFIGAIILLMLASYLICLVPLTLLILAASKGMMAFGLSQDRTQIGTKFGDIQVVLRSMLPGVFGIGVGVTALPQLFPLTTLAPESWPLSFTIIMVLYYGSMGMVLGMALFPSTWFTDDSGLVIQGLLTTLLRIPPRVDGIGNWLRTFFAGLALFLYPLVMIQRFIWTPFLTGVLSFMDFLIVFFIIVLGMPLAMMSLGIPFVILTEKLNPKIVPRILSLAERLGAREIQFQDAQVIEIPDENA
ncbi:MAG: hypothetical protein ACW960_10340 [Candidatus Thorarchaeota archaeon]|jgi:hypothetical protein